MQMKTQAMILSAATTMLLSATSQAQVLEKTFDPQLNGPWQTFVLGDERVMDDEQEEGRALGLDAQGRLMILTKNTIEGPPTGSNLYELRDGQLVAAGPLIAGLDGQRLLVYGAQLLLSFKGGRGMPTGRVGRWVDGMIEWLTTEALGAEIKAMAYYKNALFVGTKADGVWRVEDERFVRVGAKTDVLEAGFVWEAVGDERWEVESLAQRGDSLVVITKDLAVRMRGADGTWTTLGDLAEVTLDDETGLPATWMREPKALAISPNGDILVGTKGRQGSVEGRNAGRLWRWTTSEWIAMMMPGDDELREIVYTPSGSLFVDLKDRGVMRWDETSSTWRDFSTGLPSETKNGETKIKAKGLSAGADGRLYMYEKNTLFATRVAEQASWSEIGFFELGEEIASVSSLADGRVYVGAKVGQKEGAVYRLEGPRRWTQLGADLEREVKQLYVVSDARIFASLGPAGGMLWDGREWTPMTGALVGAQADFKALLVNSEGDFYAGAKQGVWRGQWRQTPIETVEVPLRGRDIQEIFELGGKLWVVTDVRGVWRLSEAQGSDDGFGFEQATAGLPEAELKGASVVDEVVYVMGKQLVYRGRVEGDVLRFEAFGRNPGKAALDGNGRVIYTGETEFKVIAHAADGTVFAGTKDGLWSSRDAGRTWSLFNGPAEVQDLKISGDVLYALVKEEPRDKQQPEVKYKRSSLWVRDLSAASAAPSDPSAPAPQPGEPGAQPRDESQPAPTIGESTCSSVGLVQPSGAAGGLWMILVAGAAAWRRRRRVH